jgi:histidinol-phosphate aminotransferase
MRNETTFVPLPNATASAYAPQILAGSVSLKLDANEGPPPSAPVLEALYGIGGEQLRRYPSARRLEAVLAERLGVPAESVVVTAGVDDGLERAVRVALCAGREAILPVPTFEMLARYVEASGADVALIPWLDGGLPVDAMLRAATPRTSFVAVVSPNNPTGLAAAPADLRRLSEAVPRALLAVDLAYAEFADEDLTRAALALPNAVAFRTFSKALGLAGLRVGYAAGPRPLVDLLRAAGRPYAVSSASLAIAEARVLAGLDDVAHYVDAVRGERARLEAFLRGRGVAVTRSQGNFAFARFDEARRVHAALGRRGVSVRSFEGSPLVGDCLRITVPGDGTEFARLIAALEEILGGAYGKEERDGQ